MMASSADYKGEHLFVPGATDTRSFRNALGTFTTGVTVVTAIGDSGPMGMTVNSFTSVSLDPPLVLWSPAKSSARHDLFARAEHFVIHVLSAEQHELGMRFARRGSSFSDLDWSVNAQGAPVISGTLARFECVRSSLHDAGDHTIIIGRVLCAAHREGAPLCFSRGSFGHFSEKVIQNA